MEEDLLCKYSMRNINAGKTFYLVTETEVYDGLKDKASHAFIGRTKRTEIMFGGPRAW